VLYIYFEWLIAR